MTSPRKPKSSRQRKPTAQCMQQAQQPQDDKLEQQGVPQEAATAAPLTTSNQEDADESASNVSLTSISSEMRIELDQKRTEPRAKTDLESRLQGEEVPMPPPKRGRVHPSQSGSIPKISNKHYPNAMAGLITESINQIIAIIETDLTQTRKVESLMGNFHARWEDFKQACLETAVHLENQLRDDKIGLSQLDHFNSWQKEYEESKEDLLARVDEYMRVVYDDMQEDEASNELQTAAYRGVVHTYNKEIIPEDSVSSIGADSKVSVASSRLELSKKRAELKANMDLQGRQQQLEQQKLQMQLQMQQQQQLLDQEKQKRALDYFEEDLNRMEGMNMPNAPPANLNCNNQAGSSQTYHFQSIPAQQPATLNSNDQFAELLKCQKAHHRLSRLPSCEPPTFDGNDPTLYPAFKIAFEALISSQCDNERDKLFYLQKYTSDGPRRLVNGCLSDGPPGFENAMHLLNEKYGNKYVVACAYLDRLKKWPNLKNGAALELNKFSLYLTEVNSCMTSIHGLEELNTFQQLKELSEKLPYNLRAQWVMEADELMGNGKLTFTHFVEYVTKQARVWNNPVFGSILCNNKPKLESENSTAVSFLTKQQQRTNEVFSPGSIEYKDPHEGKSSVQTTSTKKPKVFHCFYCFEKNSHYMRDCPKLLQFTPDENIRWLIDHHRCVNCFKKASSAHTKKTCKVNVKCAKCKGPHPTILHREIIPRNNVPQNVKLSKKKASDSQHSPNSQTATVKNANSGAQSLSLQCKDNSSKIKSHFAVIPCKIESWANPGTFIKTNMILDNASSNNFIKESLLDGIGATGKKEQISLTTLGQGDSKFSVTSLDNLRIMDLTGSKEFTLSSVYGRKVWPFQQLDVPSKKDIQDLPYLQDVPFDFIDSEIGLLIGLSSSDLLKPLQIKDAPEGLPYAIKYPFGWALIGTNEKRLLPINNIGL